MFKKLEKNTHLFDPYSNFCLSLSHAHTVLYSYVKLKQAHHTSHVKWQRITWIIHASWLTDDMPREEVLSVDFITLMCAIFLHHHSAEVFSEQFCVGGQVDPEMPEKSSTQTIRAALLIHHSGRKMNLSLYSQQCRIVYTRWSHFYGTQFIAHHITAKST